MSKPPPRTLAEIMSRAEGLFWSNRELTIEVAVAQTLRRIEPWRLEKIYRESGEGWCATALDYGSQMLITLGMEVLGQRIRKQRGDARRADNERRGVSRVEPKATADRAGLHRRRQERRSRGARPPRKNPPRSR